MQEPTLPSYRWKGAIPAPVARRNPYDKDDSKLCLFYQIVVQVDSMLDGECLYIPDETLVQVKEKDRLSLRLHHSDYVI